MLSLTCCLSETSAAPSPASSQQSRPPRWLMSPVPLIRRSVSAKVVHARTSFLTSGSSDGIEEMSSSTSSAHRAPSSEEHLTRKFTCPLRWGDRLQIIVELGSISSAHEN